VLRTAVLSNFVEYRCRRPVLQKADHPHSCAPWAQPCVRGEYVSGKPVRISPNAAACQRLNSSVSKRGIPIWTFSAWSRSREHWKFLFGRFFDGQSEGFSGVAMARRAPQARLVARRERGADSQRRAGQDRLTQLPSVRESVPDMDSSTWIDRLSRQNPSPLFFWYRVPKFRI